MYLKYSPPYGFLYTSSCSTAKYENEKKMPAHAMASCTERGRATIVEVVRVGETQFLGDARKFVGRQAEEEAPVAVRLFVPIFPRT